MWETHRLVAESGSGPVERAPARRPLSAGFIWIIVFKYLKAAAFFLLGITVLRVARLASQSEPMEIARFLGAARNKIVVENLSQVLSNFTEGQVQAIGAAALVIGLVFAVEGTLLAMRIWWATYFTIVLTALGIPPELIEIARRPSSIRRYVLLAINLAILGYLWTRRNEFRDR
jgi:uncharacterized membrane protein (DUF2068 family)